MARKSSHLLLPQQCGLNAQNAQRLKSTKHLVRWVFIVHTEHRRRHILINVRSVLRFSVYISNYVDWKSLQLHISLTHTQYIYLFAYDCNTNRLEKHACNIKYAHEAIICAKEGILGCRLVSMTIAIRSASLCYQNVCVFFGLFIVRFAISILFDLFTRPLQFVSNKI